MYVTNVVQHVLNKREAKEGEDAGDYAGHHTYAREPGTMTVRWVTQQPAARLRFKFEDTSQKKTEKCVFHPCTFHGSKDNE